MEDVLTSLVLHLYVVALSSDGRKDDDGVLSKQSARGENFFKNFVRGKRTNFKWCIKNIKWDRWDGLMESWYTCIA